jgi:hypothetical protein
VRVPGRFPAGRRRQSLPLRLAAQRPARLPLRRWRDRALPRAALGPAARPHRPPGGAAVPGAISTGRSRAREPQLREGARRRQAGAAAAPNADIPDGCLGRAVAPAPCARRPAARSTPRLSARRAPRAQGARCSRTSGEAEVGAREVAEAHAGNGGQRPAAQPARLSDSVTFGSESCPGGLPGVFGERNPSVKQLIQKGFRNALSAGALARFMLSWRRGGETMRPRATRRRRQGQRSPCSSWSGSATHGARARGRRTVIHMLSQARPLGLPGSAKEMPEPPPPAAASRAARGDLRVGDHADQEALPSRPPREARPPRAGARSGRPAGERSAAASRGSRRSRRAGAARGPPPATWPRPSATSRSPNSSPRTATCWASTIPRRRC